MELGLARAVAADRVDMHASADHIVGQDRRELLVGGTGGDNLRPFGRVFGARAGRQLENARRVIVVHAVKGEPKIVPECTLPLTAARRVSLVVTELTVIEPTDVGLVLRERAPAVAVEEIVSRTAARLIVGEEVAEMSIE